MESGTCHRCDRPVLEGTELCQWHWLQGRNNVTDATPEDLLALFELQEGRCAYTKIELVMGANASIDHIVPRSRGGADLIDNVQWVDRQVNNAKNNMTHDEFIAMCKIIVDNHYSLAI